MINILMLEDNEVDAELIRYELRKGGIEFSAVLVGTEDAFREALERRDLDVILSDYELPAFDGISALVIARSTCPEVPFIFVTGVMGEDTAIDMLRRGATDYVLKHRLNRLVPAVERALVEMEEKQTRWLAEKALKESEERYRTIFYSAATANCIIEQDTRISFANWEFERLFKLDSAALARRMSFLELLPDDCSAVEVFEERRRELLEESGAGQVSFESKMLGSTGNMLTVRISMGLLPNSDRVVLSLTDMTREKMYEEEIEERAERLGHFLMVASHELRHPLSIIKGYAATLSAHKDEMSPEDLAAVCDSMVGAADRLTRTVDKLMDISVIDGSRFVVNLQKTELEPLCRLAVNKMRKRGFSSDIDVDVSMHAAEADVDPVMFSELLFLLLENAYLYSNPPVSIRVVIEAGEEGPLVSVYDSGRGVPEAQLEKIFDRFYQVDNALHHSKPGLGIGLYMARKMVTALGGRIWCEQRDGGGSVFRFTLGE